MQKNAYYIIIKKDSVKFENGYGINKKWKYNKLIENHILLYLNDNINDSNPRIVLEVGNSVEYGAVCDVLFILSDKKPLFIYTK